MPKNKIVKKLNIIGGDKSYIPNVEGKEEEEEIFTSPIKIGNKEYNIHLLNMDEIKSILRKLDIETNKKLIKDNYDRTSFILAEAINKCNPGAKLTIESWDKMVTVDIFEKLQDKIMDITGLKIYFKPGVGEK